MMEIISMLFLIRCGCCFLYCSLTVWSTDPAIISVAPVDTVGCYGGMSTFYCGSNRSDILVIQWQIDGSIFTNEVAELRGISIITNGVGNSSLSIIGNEDNNGIFIGCVIATSDPPYIDSHSALFTVSDIPPVTNLTITFTNNGTTTMNCTWIQPSCLPVKYSYSVSINNVSVLSTNTTTTVYSISNIEPCTDYTVSVTVTDTQIIQYRSPSTRETARIRISEDFDVDLWITQIDFHDDLYRSAKIDFQVSDQYRSRLYQLFYNCSEDIYDKIVPPKYSEHSEITVIDILESYDQSTGIGNYTIGPFNESFIGNYTLKNIDEEIASTRISTFNVQNATINRLPNGSTMMECSFANNSPANGCHYEIISQNTTLRNITKDENEDTATLYTELDIPEGEYDVHVYDIVNWNVTIKPAVNTTYYHIMHLPPPPNCNSTAILNFSSTTHANVLPSTDIYLSTITRPSMIMFTISPTNIGGEGFSRLVSYVTMTVSVTVSLLVIIAVIVVAMACIIRYQHKKFQLELRSDRAIAESHIYADLPANIQSTRSIELVGTHGGTIELEDDDYMEDVLNFHNTISGPTHTERVLLPSMMDTISYEIDIGSSQIVIPSTDTGSELPPFISSHDINDMSHDTGRDFDSTAPPSYDIASSLPSICERADSRLHNTTLHDSVESEPQDTAPESAYPPSYDTATAKCEQEVNTETNTGQMLVTQSQGLTSDGHDEPFTMSTEVTTAESDQFSDSTPSSLIISSVSTPSHGPIPHTQYAQLVLNNPRSDSTHHPVPRLTESHSGYATIDQTKPVCAQHHVYINTSRRNQ